MSGSSVAGSIMNLRFHRSLGIFPGLRLNLNKGGVSLTGGVRGAHVTLGKNGLTTSMGIPGTGLSMRDKIPFSTPSSGGPSAHEHVPIPTPIPHIVESEQIPTSMWSIIENKPKFWKALLVQEGLRLIVEKAIPEWERATTVGMDIHRFCDWFRHKSDQLVEDTKQLSQICEDITASFVPPMEAQKICTAIRELTTVVEDLIGWEEEVRGFVDHPLYGDVASRLLGSSKLMVDEVARVKAKLDQQILNPPANHIIDLVFSIHLPEGWVEQVQAAIARLKAASPELREVASERVQVARADKPLGFFGLRSIQENLEAGIFLDDDWFWSADLNDWRPVKDLRIPFVDAPVVKIREALAQTVPSPISQ
jgi:hypothetical protein